MTPTKPTSVFHSVWFWRVAILLFASLMVAPSLSGDFLNWDDDRFVVDNPHVRRLTPENLVHAFSDLRFESYQPLHLLSYMIDGTLWPERPLGYRLHNLFLYLAGLLLLYEWLRRLKFTSFSAGLGTLFFAIAPYRIESVAWIACRKDVLMLVFLLGAWHLHLMSSGSRHSVLLRIGAALVFLCALLSKSSALVFPIMVFTVDISLRSKSKAAAFRTMLPYLPSALILGVALPFVWSNASLIRETVDTTFFGRVELAGWTLYHYIATVLFPFRLSPLYAAPSELALSRGLLISSAVVIVAAAALFSAIRKGVPVHRPLGTAGLVLIPLIPFLNIIPLYYLVADRYLLLPSIGLSVATATLVERGEAEKRQLGILFLSLIVLFAMGFSGALEARHWRTGETLWRHAVSREPDAYYARLKLGETLRTNGKPALSAQQYREARRIKPLSPLALGGIFWGELLVDLETTKVRNLPPPEQLTARFLSMANDGPKLRRFAADLKNNGLHRAAAVVRERIAPPAR